jgi:UDP-N-acetyl-D-glucosamine/UDP-N-acetyl-D-galactosamine dehydrogenase
VPDIVAELAEFGIEALVADPLADPAAARREHGIDLAAFERLQYLDAAILAVPHRHYAEAGWTALFAALTPGGILVDVKSAVPRAAVPKGIRYWSL